jgi:DNA-binding ferritin-like protein
MLELIQKIIAFKYSAKLAHWKSTNYAQHLLYDRLQEDLDDIVDGIAEQYYMAGGQAASLSAAVLEPKYVTADLAAAIKGILATIDQLVAKGDLSEGITSLVTDTASQFLGKLALVNLK